jgi:hypothetical protein
MLNVFAEVSVEVSGSEEIEIGCLVIASKAREKFEFKALAREWRGGNGEAGTE